MQGCNFNFERAKRLLLPASIVQMVSLSGDYITSSSTGVIDDSQFTETDHDDFLSAFTEDDDEHHHHDSSIPEGHAPTLKRYRLRTDQ